MAIPIGVAGFCFGNVAGGIDSDAEVLRLNNFHAAPHIKRAELLKFFKVFECAGRLGNQL